MLTMQNTKICFGQGAFKPYSSTQEQGTDHYSITTQNKVDIDKTNHDSAAKVQSSSNEINSDVNDSSAELKIEHENNVNAKLTMVHIKIFWQL